jgi:hypothetical protein
LSWCFVDDASGQPTDRRRWTPVQLVYSTRQLLERVRLLIRYLTEALWV